MNIKTMIMLALLFCFACDELPTDNQDFQSSIKLRDDLSKVEFKEAVIGKWETVFEVPGKENIEYLEISRKGNVKIIIKKDNTEKKYNGNYSIDFLRPPSEGKVTLAELTIKTFTENIILSSVNFGLHNAFPVDKGCFLRVDTEPYGVMERKDI